jgi:hypothetical protein
MKSRMNRTIKLVTPIVLLASLLASCGPGGVEKPMRELDVEIPTSSPDSSGGSLQCISKVINGDEKRPQYRNIYFTTGMDGTETIQSQVVGPIPCP